MTRRKNILFIMADQLRADYLSCYGHKTLHTPNIDALAARGTRFDRAYCQSTVCGSSRMSFYTGRYVRSHGATWNDTPLPVGEATIGDHLAAVGMRTLLVGKTHVRPDLAGMARLGIDPASERGRLIAQGGFEPWLREDGIYLGTGDQRRHFAAHYNRWLAENGYDGDNPWLNWANSVEVDGQVMSGWYLDAASHPVRATAEHTETPYLTEQAIRCIDAQGDQPWLIHLSYIKPHWPYVAPAPYHAMFGSDQVQPAQRDEAERTDPHPVFSAFQDLRVSHAFADEAVRQAVVPAYMGLVKQIDDSIGVLMAALAARGLLADTMIVLTADHGDYLGDHWLGEKDFMHEPSARIPLIVVDPDVAAPGVVSKALVEAIDLAPTFVEFAGGDPTTPHLQGRSLIPLLRGETPDDWRRVAFAEYDYSALRVRHTLNQPIDRSTIVMAVSDRWKLIHFPGFRPMLFDLATDPHELVDLGADPAYHAVRADLMQAILDWSLTPARTTESDAAIEQRTDTQVQRGIWLGLRNAAEHVAVLAAERAETVARRGEAVG